MTQDAQLIEPLVQETWVMDGNALDTRPQDANALHCAVGAPAFGAAPQDLRDYPFCTSRQQCLTDMLENRRPSVSVPQQSFPLHAA